MSASTNGAIERGVYGRFALATPDNGDQIVEVFQVTTSSNHPEAGLVTGKWYWQSPSSIDAETTVVVVNGEAMPEGPFDNETAALDDARSHFNMD